MQMQCIADIIFLPFPHTCLAFSSVQAPFNLGTLVCRCVVCTQGGCLPGLGHAPGNAEGLSSLETEGTAQLHSAPFSAAFDLHAPRAAANGKAKTLHVLRDLELFSVLQPILSEIPLFTVV